MPQEDVIGFMNWVGLIWFLFCWIAYSQFAKFMATRTASLSSVMHVHRINWMRRLLTREVRVGDAALLANVERNVNFFASSCVLVLAGLLTALTAVHEIRDMLSKISFATIDSILAMEIKVVVMICVFIYAFFTFTWSMRQFGFASALVGAAPMPNDNSVTPADRRSFAIYAAKVIDQASHSYNNGLRAFYFSLALLLWFVNVWLLMAAAAVIVGILYEREFLSRSLKALKMIEHVGDKLASDDNELSNY
ncbi:DUF599 domain-containing protein [Oceanobacter mangrovi]|uniref:DUF599 domain-containing protein n=1 Tax=Oceanobacter mangrovi TaxID=2862510 RepID=UPI001FE87F23|nr:DUF599 domain-containing protein [Oceanobacter mangrovi]